MPPGTDADFLRRHGLHMLADWAENILIAPAYARQDFAVLGLVPLTARHSRLRRVGHEARARVPVRGRGRGQAPQGRPARPVPSIWRRCCCRLPQYSQEFARMRSYAQMHPGTGLGREAHRRQMIKTNRTWKHTSI